jgi:DNA polymerase III epsilon subunit-like protein
MVDKFGQEYLDDWLGVHMRETRWARRLLKKRRFTCLDTETTSVNIAAEMTEVGITDGRGKVLCDTLVRPLGKMTTEAINQTGITDQELKSAPRLKKVRSKIQAALDTHPVCLIYNAEFDLRILNQSTFQVGLPEFKMPKVIDLMLRFSRWTGEWNPRQDDYAWLRLEGGHRAVGDCRAMINLMEKMARVPQTNSSWNPTRPEHVIEGRHGVKVGKSS